jgi:alpha-glucosidase
MALRRAIERALAVGPLVWVRSNHDSARLQSLTGPDRLEAMLLLLLTLPGRAVLYQGDELGLIEGPGARTKLDRAGRDRLRHPMQWDPSPNAGFTTGDPWLPVVRPHDFNVESQHDDPRSVLTHSSASCSHSEANSALNSIF